MTEKLQAAAKTTRFQAWKWLGAMFMETKVDPETGKATLATGLTRIMALAMFVALMVMWLTKPELVQAVGEVTDPVPDSMLYTFWGLLGLKGVNAVSDAIKGAKGGGTPNA